MIRQIDLAEREADFSRDTALHSGDRTIIYKGTDEQALRLSVYEPDNYADGDKFPLFVFVHGGGWQGRKIFEDQSDWSGDYLGFLARHYAEQGYLCVSVDYRLMREKGQKQGFELIDLCEDCADAVAYLKAHAEELKIDLGDTTVLGESAGGYLAAALVTLPFCDRDFFKSAILVNPITDMTDPKWMGCIAESSAHPLLKNKSMAEKASLLSPVTYITHKTCRTLLLHGAQDSVVHPFHSLKFHDLLNACGVSAQLDFIAETDHAFLLVEYMREKGIDLRAATAAVQTIDDWMDRMLSH